MDYSVGEGSTSHILLSDSVSQPSNYNSDTDVSTDISIAATPQESGMPTAHGCCHRQQPRVNGGDAHIIINVNEAGGGGGGDCERRTL